MILELLIWPIIPNPPGVVCMEDNQCWDPSTMGDLRSGPGVWVVNMPNGKYVVTLREKAWDGATPCEDKTVVWPDGTSAVQYPELPAC